MYIQVLFVLSKRQIVMIHTYIHTLEGGHYKRALGSSMTGLTNEPIPPPI